MERRVTELETRLAAGGSKTGPGEKKEDGVSLVEDGAKSVSAGEKKPKTQIEEKEDKGGKTEKEDEEDEFGDDRYLVVLNSLDSELGEYKDRRADAAPKKVPTTDKKASIRAFIFCKMMRSQLILGDDVLRPMGSEVDVESIHLQKLLGDIMRKYEGDAKVMYMSSPYVNLVWLWEKVVEEADEKNIKPDASDDDKTAREDLRVLLGMN